TATVKGTEIKDTIKIIVVEQEPQIIPVSSVTIAGGSAGVVGGTITLTATVLPANATNKTVTWSTADQTVATVQIGIVTLLKEGSVTITATADGKSATHSITVSTAVINVESVEITGDEEGIVGETLELSATVLPANATNKTVTWSSSD